MTKVIQEFKYIDEDVQIMSDHEQERKTNELTQITSNIYQYDYQKSSKMDGENKRKRKWNAQFIPQKYHKNNASYKHLTYKYHNDNMNKTIFRSKTSNHLESNKPSQNYESTNEDYIQIKTCSPENTCFHNINHELDTISLKSQKSKTPISLINEWAMRGDGSSDKKPYVVSYTLVDITGHAHKPIFTYMCQVNDKTAKGEGPSKKKAKQNAAAQMWEKLVKISSTTNNDKAITSTTPTDNFEVNEVDTTNLTSTEGSQLINETDSNTEDEELRHSNNDSVKLAHCNMNPVGALQELSTAFKWPPPFYTFQKLWLFNKDGVYKKLSYRVTCKVFHLKTTGTASTKKEAKRLAAHEMFDQIRNIGEEKLNALKSLEFKNGCELEPEENEKLPLKWNSALIFRSYFTAAISETVNIVTDTSSTSFTSENKEEKAEIQIQREYQNELEQSIIQFNLNLNCVNQLQALSRQLHFDVMYMCFNNLDEEEQKAIKNNSGHDEEFTVLVQVTTIPFIVTIGHAKSVYKAAEVAASSVLQTLKNMLIYTSSSLIPNQNKDGQDKVVKPCISVLKKSN